MWFVHFEMMQYHKHWLPLIYVRSIEFIKVKKISVVVALICFSLSKVAKRLVTNQQQALWKCRLCAIPQHCVYQFSKLTPLIVSKMQFDNCDSFTLKRFSVTGT